jgi:hypothetical protein
MTGAASVVAKRAVLQELQLLHELVEAISRSVDQFNQSSELGSIRPKAMAMSRCKRTDEMMGE